MVVIPKVYHYGLSAIDYRLSAHSVSRLTSHDLRLTTRPYRLPDSPTRHPDDTPLTSDGYLAEFVRFTLAKDGTRIDDFTYQPRDRDRW
jgi:hypothetical protein